MADTRLERKRFMQFLSLTGEAGSWEPLGKDTDDLSKELNPDTENSKNVLGEATFKIKGYEPEIAVDTYYLTEESAVGAKVNENAMLEKYGDTDLKGKLCEAYFSTVNETAGTMSGTAYVRDCYIIPQSIGGDTSGYNIPINVNPVGAVTNYTIVYTVSTRTAVLTPVQQ